MDYKEILKGIVNIINTAEKSDIGFANICTYIGENCPELKESEDERIRKELTEFLKSASGGFLDTTTQCKTFGKWVAWLEKQGKVDTVSYEIAEKEKYDFVSGQFIKCRKSFDAFKEGNSYWLEYVGDDNYIGRSDNILNQKFHITPGQLYCLFIQEHSSKEDNVNEEANAPIAYGKYVDECLNEASEHFFSEGEDKYSVADLFYAGVRCGKSWLEKQDDKDKLIQELGKYKVKYTQEVLEKHINSISNKDNERLRKTTIAFLKDFADKGYENAVECIDWLEKQGKQKPTEWSEKDENILEDTKEAVINTWGGDTQDIILEWLESLKQRIGG